MNSVGQEVFIEDDTHARCFDSLAVSNNIRYFYHISSRWLHGLYLGRNTFWYSSLKIPRDSRACRWDSYIAVTILPSLQGGSGEPTIKLKRNEIQYENRYASFRPLFPPSPPCSIGDLSV